MAQRFTIGATNSMRIPGTDLTMPLYQLIGMPIALGVTKTLARRIANEQLEKAKGDPFYEGKARELDALATKFELQWANTFGIAIDPLITNYYQTDPMLETSVRVVSSVANISQVALKALHKVATKTATAAILGAAQVTQKTGQLIQSARECGGLMLEVLNRDVRSIYVPGLSPKGIDRIPLEISPAPKVDPWVKRPNDTD
jgi:hypothetical protein